MKNCELCKVRARTFCESDQASLCWGCDAKVHGANFLVARHTRTLLCHNCHSLTPWKASGAALGNTVSLCVGCAGGTRVDAADEGEESEVGNDDYIDTQDDEDDEDGDNQVVPWSSTDAAVPPSPSSSSSQESVTRYNHGDDDVSDTATTVSSKRRREDHDSQEDPKRRCVDFLAAWDGEPSSMVSPASAMDRFNGSRGCCDSREAEGV